MHLAMQAMRKVPEVTIYFWIIKLLSTAMGESTSDYLVYHINPYIAVALGSIGLIASLVLQLLVRRYVAWIYWLAVVMVAVFGTMAADVTHVVLGISYLVSTVFFAVALAVIFVVWFWKPSLGGLGLCDTQVALVLTILIIGFVGYLTVTRKDMKGEQR